MTRGRCSMSLPVYPHQVTTTNSNSPNSKLRYRVITTLREKKEQGGVLRPSGFENKVTDSVPGKASVVPSNAGVAYLISSPPLAL